MLGGGVDQELEYFVYQMQGQTLLVHMVKYPQARYPSTSSGEGVCVDVNR